MVFDIHDLTLLRLGRVGLDEGIPSSLELPSKFDTFRE